MCKRLYCPCIIFSSSLSINLFHPDPPSLSYTGDQSHLHRALPPSSSSSPPSSFLIDGVELRFTRTITISGGSEYHIDNRVLKTESKMEVPTPVVIIDQDSDPDATVVEVTFGDRLGALLDTMNALKNLGLNVVKANVYLDSSGKHNKFAITKAGRKVEDPELLEAIRLTVINNLLEFHPNQVLNWRWEQLLVYFHQLNRLMWTLQHI
ncbi:hypothetical protein Bca101_056889 [Brassica carinata]